MAAAVAPLPPGAAAAFARPGNRLSQLIFDMSLVVCHYGCIMTTPDRTPTRVREFREAAGLSQQALAVRADIAISTLSRIESGEGVRLGTLSQLAAALGVPVADLLVTEDVA